MFNIFILFAGIAAIAWINWYFFFAPKPSATAESAPGGLQQVTITVEGGYSPAVVRVKNNTPVRLIFDRKEKSPCSDEVVISDFGIRRFLPAFSQTAIDFTPTQPGSIPFTCGMNMLRGRIEVQN